MKSPLSRAFFVFTCLPILMSFSESNLTPIEPSVGKLTNEGGKWENEKRDNGCNNHQVLKIIKNEMCYKDLPSKSLLMTSKVSNIKELFDEFFEDKELSKMINDCGNYVYLKYLKTVIFTINENVDMVYLQNFLQLLVNNDVCIEFNQDVAIL
ncbi:conserved Plasmodium protein, unknown function [Plasmodium ovale]|uniref:Uncharacterized protein n=2 Tax=Plasmodium ovale TaxID=36330 RepID=A0A1C3KJ07_PLAOA|nr:conserved Plasmodium protein, unknown function [Plasmodium ovale]